LKKSNKNENRHRSRRLLAESLESRQLLASDLVHHNFVMPEDADASGYVSPLDVLIIINQINSARSNPQTSAAVDVDADGSLTPLDALIVINHLNRNSAPGVDSPSSVNVDRRISKLEEAINTFQLPPTLDLGTAQQALAVLRTGGFPELGDRMLNGIRTPRDATSSAESMRMETLIANYVVSDDFGMGSQIVDAQQLSQFVEALEARLGSMGVSNQNITVVISEIYRDVGSSMHDILGQVQSRLAQLSINAEMALPERLDVQVNQIVARLRALGVSQQAITTISNDLRIGFETNKPLTFEQIKSRLNELGIDASRIFPSESDQFINQLIAKLEAAGVNPTIVSQIGNELKAAFATNNPLSIDQLKERLQSLGVSSATITSVFPNRGSELLESFVRTLETVGVSGQVINTIVNEIETSIDNGLPLSFDEVMTRLKVLGVDTESIFPETAPLSVELVAAVLARSQVSPESIASVVSAMISARMSGAPLTLEQIKTVMTSNGIDLSTVIFPSGPTSGQFAPPLETALMVFRRVKVNEAVIANMELLIAQGLSGGQPMSVDTIIERMRGLGVELPQTLDWLFNYGGR
jgi:hypothetical protein